MMKASLSIINFNKLLMVIFTRCGLAFLVSCGSSQEDVKIIRKDIEGVEDMESNAVSSTEIKKKANYNNKSAGEMNTEDADPVDGYCFRFNGVEMKPDMEATPVLEELGKAQTYFEAPSCAFEGLDKIYGYEHFEIHTYPENDTDYIAAVILLDDLVETEEGIALGASKNEVIGIYGDSYEVNGTSLVYIIGESSLSFFFKNENVAGIAYDSMKLKAEE